MDGPTDNTEQSFDLAVIGGGPAGYVAAIRAAQLGLRAVCVERDELGGVCLNWGCIPSKTLLSIAEFYEKLRTQAPSFGIEADNVRHQWSKVIERSRAVASQLNQGIAALLRKHRVTHVPGVAKVLGPGQVQVEDATGDVHQLRADHIVVATGARPRSLPGMAFDGERIISYKQAMSLAEQPKKLVIVGAGAIGMEFAYFYSAFGTEVVMVEMLDRLLPNEDEEVSRAIERSWRRRNIEFHVATRTQGVTETDSGVELAIASVSDAADSRSITGEKVLVAVGVAAHTDGLFGPSMDVELDGDHIKVDRLTYQSSVPGIYAVGDVIGPPWLAHVASEEAIVCVEQIAGKTPVPIDYESVPACTYCHPQVASLGRTERQCIDQGQAYSVGKFPMSASGKAQAIGATEGFVKILTDERYGEVLGVHMIGENVTELLAEMGLAKRLEATAGDIIATMHAHPTLSEAVHEAALGTRGRMLHA